MKQYYFFDVISFILLIIGGLNWGLIGIFDWDLIASIFGYVVSRIIYIAIGFAVVYRMGIWIKTKAK